MTLSPHEAFTFVKATEESISLTKQLPPDRPLKEAVALWLDLDGYLPIEQETPILLEEVTNALQWNSMFHLRASVEAAFGNTDAAKITKMIDEIKLCQSAGSGRWFLGKLETGGPYIGEIGSGLNARTLPTPAQTGHA